MPSLTKFNHPMELNKLIQIISTKSEAQDIIYALSLIRDGLYQTPPDFKTLAKKYLPVRFYEKLFVFFETRGIDLEKNQDVTEALDEIIKTVKNLPTLRLILSFQPTSSIVETIQSWLTNHGYKNVLVELSVDYSLIAGAVTQFKGRYDSYFLLKK